MPLRADPNATLRIVLAADADKDPQPCFIYRHLTYRQWAALDALRENMAAQDAQKTIAEQFQWLTEGLVGWENIRLDGQPLAFNADAICDVVTMFEAQEILLRRLSGAVPGLDDKKKLPSLSPSGTENSAADAEAP